MLRILFGCFLSICPEEESPADFSNWLSASLNNRLIFFWYFVRLFLSLDEIHPSNNNCKCNSCSSVLGKNNKYQMNCIHTTNDETLWANREKRINKQKEKQAVADHFRKSVRFAWICYRSLCSHIIRISTIGIYVRALYIIRAIVSFDMKVVWGMKVDVD